MDALLGLMDNLTDPDWIVAHGGLYLLLFIIFAETGIMIGFFLPGDPILFIAGIIISNMSVAPGQEIPLLLYWILLIALAAIAGNFVGYWCGKLFGNRILNMKESWLFRREYIYKAQEFYEKQGGVAIILARFLPIVRTFAPIVAGIVGMDFKKFIVFNILGAFLWSGSLVTLGFVLGENQWVQKNLELVIFLIVAAATAPVIIKAISGRGKARPTGDA
ncbi:MAG TPA: VTT domain-containing protein [Candidatus Sphingobacterium stercorigallinarum]|nr:VTT domain-containing protein [Candidatus Sphingobacterium stercorigallinarum]